jgi:hypothetical protein
MKKQTSKAFLATLLGAGMTHGILHAQNPFHEPGDLVLFFQKPGNNNSVLVSLGSAATLYRGGAAGPTADRQAPNIVNINSELTTALRRWLGLGSRCVCRIDRLPRFQHRNRCVSRGPDPHALRLTLPRGRGHAGSGQFLDLGLQPQRRVHRRATNAIAFGNIFETNYNTKAAVSPVSVSKVNTYNPFVNTSLGIQNTAFSAFPGGVQQRGSATSFGTFGPVSSPEFLLDLYRIVPRADADTDGEVSGVRRIGSYEGTVTISSAGGVSFISRLIPTYVDTDGDGLSDFLETLLNSPEYGFDPNVSQPDRVAAFMQSEGFYTEDSIQDLVTSGQMMIQATGANVNLQLPVFKSQNLGSFVPAGNMTLTIPKVENKEFYRIQLGE